jgi:hypothetical protein
MTRESRKWPAVALALLAGPLVLRAFVARDAWNWLVAPLGVARVDAWWALGTTFVLMCLLRDTDDSIVVKRDTTSADDAMRSVAHVGMLLCVWLGCWLVAGRT